MLALRTAVRKVERLAYSPDGSRLAVGGPTGTEVIKVDGGETVALFDWLSLSLCAFRADNNSLLVAYYYHMMTIVDLGGTLINPFPDVLGLFREGVHTWALLGAMDEWLDTDLKQIRRRRLASVSEKCPSGQATVWASAIPDWNVSFNRGLTIFGVPPRVAILANLQAVADDTRTYLYLLDGDTGELIRRHRCGYPCVDHFTGSPCGGYLVGVRQATLIVWDTAALHRPPRRWANDSRKQFTGVAFHPHGRYLLTASNDKSVKLWDLTCGQVVRSYDWSAGRMRSVAVAPDGLTAAAGSDENLVVIFDLDL